MKRDPESHPRHIGTECPNVMDKLSAAARTTGSNHRVIISSRHGDPRGLLEAFLRSPLEIPGNLSIYLYQPVYGKPEFVSTAWVTMPENANIARRQWVISLSSKSA